jgi:hypothetical protein
MKRRLQAVRRLNEKIFDERETVEVKGKKYTSM